MTAWGLAWRTIARSPARSVLAVAGVASASLPVALLMQRAGRRPIMIGSALLGACAALLWHGDDGRYRCVGCGEVLFEAKTKFDAGCGWPSYYEPVNSEVVERIVENDDEAMAAYLEGNEPSVEKLKEILRKAVINNQIFPVYCGSALKNKGVQLILDAVVDYLPSPLDLPAAKGKNTDKR